MNTHAQAGNYAVAFMLAISLIIVAIAWAAPVNEIVTDAMGNSSTTNHTDFYGNIGQSENLGMNCTSTGDDFMKAGCVSSDLSQFYFIAGILAIGGAIIAARIIFS